MSAKRFKSGDHVSWNSEAGRVRGTITRVVRSEIEFKGYTVHASKDEPQYGIRSADPVLPCMIVSRQTRRDDGDRREVA